MAPSGILDMPVDEAITLRPTRILYIVPQSGWARDTMILDLTAQLHASYPDNLSPEFKASAKRLASSTPPIAPIFTLTRAHWYSSSRLTVTDTAGAQLAEWHSPLMAYGVTRIRFPADSPHCGHALDVKPLGVGRRAQSFINNSVMCAWETGGRFKSGRMSLYKAIGAKKVEAARYESDSGTFIAGGLLVLDTREVDELVALLTCLAVLNQRDAFYMPGLDLGSRR
jgi:hypothetical protein